jgi:hypothetical protein
LNFLSNHGTIPAAIIIGGERKMNNLSKVEVKQKVAEMLDAGTSKTEVFKTLSGGAVKDRVLAYYIAAHAFPLLCAKHDGKVNGLITMMFIQALIAALAGYALGAKIGPNAAWIFPALCAVIPLLIAYGFYKNSVGAYNAYIILTLASSHNLFKGFTEAPITSSISIAIAVGMFMFVWYVRSLLFPDFAVIGPRKAKGNYVFST